MNIVTFEKVFPVEPAILDRELFITKMMTGQCQPASGFILEVLKVEIRRIQVSMYTGMALCGAVVTARAFLPKVGLQLSGKIMRSLPTSGIILRALECLNVIVPSGKLLLEGGQLRRPDGTILAVGDVVDFVIVKTRYQRGRYTAIAELLGQGRADVRVQGTL